MLEVQNGGLKQVPNVKGGLHAGLRCKNLPQGFP